MNLISMALARNCIGSTWQTKNDKFCGFQGPSHSIPLNFRNKKKTPWVELLGVSHCQSCDNESQRLKITLLKNMITPQSEAWKK